MDTPEGAKPPHEKSTPVPTKVDFNQDYFNLKPQEPVEFSLGPKISNFLERIINEKKNGDMKEGNTLNNMLSENLPPAVKKIIALLRVKPNSTAPPSSFRFFVDAIEELKFLWELYFDPKGEFKLPNNPQINLKGLIDNIVTQRTMSINLGYYPQSEPDIYRYLGAYVDDKNLYICDATLPSSPKDGSPLVSNQICGFESIDSTGQV